MNNENLSFIEIFSCMLSIWGIDLYYKNLYLNLGQQDKDDLMQKLDEQTTLLLDDIHKQLELQNNILNEQTKLLKSIVEKR